ncbi:hypothetical protein [Reticulibacter mediterranei]|uniref:hypothetical protein n=1 Tax=Reticulibacter mediterranei TaxID=2778369 RepID=UPI001F37E759|nr:hypothetical protein [Reticulibacter mediterranei]
MAKPTLLPDPTCLHLKLLDASETTITAVVTTTSEPVWVWRLLSNWFTLMVGASQWKVRWEREPASPLRSLWLSCNVLKRRNCSARQEATCMNTANIRRRQARGVFDGHGDCNIPETFTGDLLNAMGLSTLTGRCW